MNEKEWKIQQWWTWKAKGTKKCVIKRKLRFQDYKKSLEAVQIERKINYLRKNNWYR